MENIAEKAKEKGILKNRDILDKYKPEEPHKKQKDCKGPKHWDGRMTPSLRPQSTSLLPPSHLVFNLPDPWPHSPEVWPGESTPQVSGALFTFLPIVLFGYKSL